ncbi:MAG: XRE family transcriptional regulator [Thermomicrobiales bacterium]|nr:XRE family transcriptional regulator [Thermomicrobiales bacterium]
MTNTRRFSDLARPLLDDPVQRARIHVYRAAISDALRLAEIRRETGLTQRDLAQVLDITQADVARIEDGPRLYVDTLAEYIEALGGHLEIRAILPNRSVEILSGQRELQDRSSKQRVRSSHQTRVARHPRLVARGSRRIESSPKRSNA